jgi:hypothetical protein
MRVDTSPQLAVNGLAAAPAAMQKAAGGARYAIFAAICAASTEKLWQNRLGPPISKKGCPRAAARAP